MVKTNTKKSVKKEKKTEERSCEAFMVLDSIIKKKEIKKISFESISNRVIINFPYDKEVIRIIKTIKNRKNDNDMKKWTIPSQYYDQTVKQFKCFN